QFPGPPASRLRAPAQAFAWQSRTGRRSTAAAGFASPLGREVCRWLGSTLRSADLRLCHAAPGHFSTGLRRSPLEPLRIALQDTRCPLPALPDRGRLCSCTGLPARLRLLLAGDSEP